MGLFSSRSKEKPKGVEWVAVHSVNELEQVLSNAEDQTVILFKHSTRCSISTMALSRLESNWDIPLESALPVYIDLIKHRDISNHIADKYNVRHESPQILMIKEGACVYDASHGQIAVRSIKSAL